MKKVFIESIYLLFRIHGHMSSVRVQHDVYAQVLVNHVYDADVLPRVKANNGWNFSSFSKQRRISFSR